MLLVLCRGELKLFRLCRMVLCFEPAVMALCWYAVVHTFAYEVVWHVMQQGAIVLWYGVCGASVEVVACV